MRWVAKYNIEERRRVGAQNKDKFSTTTKVFSKKKEQLQSVDDRGRRYN